jgi:hypothetical protein
MTIDRTTRWVFQINAVINWGLSIPGIVDPNRMAVAFGGLPPNYPFVIRLWQGFVFMFGCMFWEVGRNVRGKAALIKYNWIEKTITALAVTSGFLSGEAPTRLMVLIVFTNWLWIPLILYCDRALHRAMAHEATA